jgi:hypothetical protein
MPRHLIRAFLALSASAAVTVTLGLAAARPANASEVRMSAHRASPECLILPNCVSLYQFSPANSAQLVLEATGAVRGAPVILSAEDPADPGQDWTYIDLGTVGGYRTQGLPRIMRLSRFDVARYASDEMYQLEFSPAGFPTGFCAANIANRMKLRACNGSRFQTMISASDIRGVGASPLSYSYGLSVVQAAVAAHHLSVTGSRSEGAKVTFSRPVNSSNLFWQPS